MPAAKNAPKKRGRPFEPGHAGGPGRPSGSRNAATLVLDKMAEDDAKAVLQAQLTKAKEGDQRAAEIILARVWPIRKGRAVALSIPPIVTATDIVAALGAVVDAVVAGEITPDEGAAVAGVFETKRRAMETTDLAKRIEALEAEKKQ